MSVPPSRSAYNRPALIALVVVAFAACLALAWWQWERYESAAGTAQNLGYALQWPLFAGFVVFAYIRFVRLERDAGEREAGAEAAEPGVTAAEVTQPDAAEPARPAEPGAAKARRRRKQELPREIPAGILPERPKAARSTDPALTEYNRYLAQLHAAHVEKAVRTDLGAGTSERSAG
ncbi:transcriptional regulator [Nocardia higoensis]|uniref:transcriptional regulator n=1 Tax=Nocardia higoensis TaxID=228599 RepID=UPI0003159517|nr:transcriptional regulator [Nocardia higoensis]